VEEEVRPQTRNKKAKAALVSEEDAFRAPMKVVQSYIVLNKFPKNRIKAMNESVVADILGSDPVHIPDSGAPQHVRGFLYSTLELYASHARFDDYEIMLKRYPWRGKIGYRTHFFIAMHAILSECYIFEERLKRFFKSIRECAQNSGCEFPEKESSRTTIRSHILLTFESTRNVWCRLELM
jgi:hypothetical protein